MKLYFSLPKNLPKTSLTIGTFDGLHLGHQTIIRKMRELSSHTTLLTFLNHPAEIIKPELKAPKLLTPTPIKLSLLDKLGVDAVIVLPFTKEFAKTSYQELLNEFSLSHLVFGKGDYFGKNREGTEENVRRYAEGKNIFVEYLDKKLHEGAPISSSRIRSLIKENRLEEASELLGRPFSIYYPPLNLSLALPEKGERFFTSGSEKYRLTFSEEKIVNITPEPPSSLFLELENKESYV